MDSKRIKEKIRAKGVSLRQVAEKIGITPQNLQMRLSVKSLSVETLELVASALGESVSYFYNELPILTIEDYAEVCALRTEVEYLKKLVTEKDKIIAILSENPQIACKQKETNS